MEKKYGYIYKIISPTGKIYIGKSTNIDKRINTYKGLNCKKQPLIYNSLLKYGFSAHTINILYEGENTLKELNEIEIYFIGFFDSFYLKNKNGMNLTLGGDGGFGRKISEEHKEKIRNFNRNRVREKHSEETKKLISESRKKTGKTLAHQKGIDSLKGRKIIKSKEWVKNNSESVKKPILQYDKENNLIKEWKSAKDVELELGLCRKNISKNLTNKTKQAYGYIWRYK